jgi:phosphatidate cytidylyltransferase
MALNIATLKTRALTALIFVTVMLVGLLWNKWSFLALFTIVHFGCWLEYLKLVEKIYDTTIDLIIKWFFAICGFTLMIVLGFQYFWADIYFNFFSSKVGFKWLILVTEIVCLIIFFAKNKQVSNTTKWICFAGFIYVSISLTALLNLRDNYFLKNENFDLLDIGKVYVCCILFSIWINDTMAYIVGSLIGKTPFSKISPKKTWEGTIGGAILCVVVMYFGGMIFNGGGWIHQNYLPHIAIIAGLCAIFGTIGDLFESKLKRMADVKDSGTIMPGHGGFLDRFDSLLFAAPAVWVYVKLFM